MPGGAIRSSCGETGPTGLSASLPWSRCRSTSFPARRPDSLTRELSAEQSDSHSWRRRSHSWGNWCCGHCANQKRLGNSGPLFLSIRYCYRRCLLQAMLRVVAPRVHLRGLCIVIIVLLYVGIGPVQKTPRTEPGQKVSGDAALKKIQYKD